jgi:hypothetical protein
MPISKSTSESKTVFELSDETLDIEIQILDTEPVEMRLWTEDVHMIEVAENEAEGWSPSKEEFVDAIEDRLDLILDHVPIIDAAAYEASFELTEDSIVIAGSRWGGPEELYPG